jgi:RHS repeat-associated protein
MAARRLRKGGWTPARAGSRSGNAARARHTPASRRLGLVVALALCVTGIASAAPSAGAAAARASVATSRAGALAARRALVRRELSPAGEHAAARAALGRLHASVSKPPSARLRRIAAQEARAAARHSGADAGLPRPARAARPGPAAPLATSTDSGLPIPIGMTGPGGAVLASDCTVSCNTDSMVVPGEPVTMSGQIWNDSDPPVTEQVQVQFQQFCPATDSEETMATTTVSAPSFFGAATSGTPVSASFQIEPASCDTGQPDGFLNYSADVLATVVGGTAGEASIQLFDGSVPSAQLQGCACSPDSSGGMAAQDFRGDAVDTGTGEYTDSFTDATTNSPGVPLSVTRNYSSGVTAAGPLGRGWTMPWFASLSVSESAGTVTFNSENGSQYAYAGDGDGPFAAPLGALSVLTAVTDSSGDVTGYDLTTPHQAVLSFNVSGQLTSDLDSTGRGLKFGYISGQLTSVTDAAGQQATLTYTASRLSAIALPNGTSITYGYTGGLLTSVVTPTGSTGDTTSYAYNSAGLLTTSTGPDGGTVLQNSYNPAGQVTSSTDGTGAVTRFSYTTVSGLAETDTTDPDGGVWTDVYAGGMLLQTIDPLGGTTEYVPGDLLLPVSVTDPLGEVTTLSYDDNGNLLSETDPLSRQQTWSYDASNNLTSYTDGNGRTTTFSYNSMDEVTSVTGATAGKATFTYTAAGNLSSRVDPRGNVSGATASSFTTTYAYNSTNGLLASVTSPGSPAETFAYNTMGLPLTVTDPAGLVTKYTYNDQQQVTTITAADGGVTRYGYDPAGYLTSRTDPDGHVWTYGYDGDGRVVKSTDPLGKPVSYAYDGDGNQVKLTDARGQTTTTGYDADGRPVTITYSDGTPTVSYGYDAGSRVTSVTDASGTRALKYDADGELTSAGGFSYGYDADGNVTSRTYPDKTAVTYTYTAGEQIASVSQGSSKTSYTYDPAGNLAKAVQPDKVTQTFTYNDAGRLTKLSAATSTATLDSYGLTLNADGLPTAVAVTLDGTAQPAQSYTYDAAGRLASGSGTSYAYDAAGNLVSATTGTVATTYSHNTDDELTKAVTGSTTTTYGYNADGDRNSAGAAAFTYNAAGELTSRSTTAGKVTYSYDASGDPITASENGTTRSTSWDINNPLPVAAEETIPSGSPTDATARTPGGAAPRSPAAPAATGTTSTVDYAYGADGLLASLTVPAGTYDPVTDWLGSITGLVSSAGTQATKTSYGPYGAATTTSLVTGAPTSSIGYAGSYILPGSGGLDSMGARDYDPSTGAFQSPDPMLAVSGQPYAYASDVPDFYADPSGRLFGIDNLIAGGLGALAGAGGVLFNELLYGKHVKWSSIGIAAVSGFVFGAVADECGTICAGAASGFVTDGLTQIVNHQGFSDFNFQELAAETAQGAAVGTIDEFLGNGGGKHAAEDTASLVSKYALPDFLVGATDPAAIAANPLGALCAIMDSPGDSGL